MTEWFYKATLTKVSLEDTRALAVDDGFLCRSAFETNGSRADNTQHVRFPVPPPAPIARRGGPWRGALF
jgi:hypothetical protein